MHTRSSVGHDMKHVLYAELLQPLIHVFRALAVTAGMVEIVTLRTGMHPREESVAQVRVIIIVHGGHFCRRWDFQPEPVMSAYNGTQGWIA